MSRGIKNAKQLERHFKGVANHRRLEILLLVARQEGINLDQIAESLCCNLKTISEHTRKLVQAGLLEKHYQGRTAVRSFIGFRRMERGSIYLSQHFEKFDFGYSYILQNVRMFEVG